MVAGMHVAAHTVLGCVQSHQLHSGSLVEDVDGGAQVIVHAGGVGDQPHALALQRREVLVAQHLNTGFHRLSRSAHGQQAGKYSDEKLFHDVIFCL